MLKSGIGRKIAAAKGSGLRRASLAGLAAVVLVCSLAATAWALGELTQKPGAAGCISRGGSEGCRPGVGLNGASGVVTSPDGRNVYVASFFSGEVAIFSRNPDGTLDQPPGAAGCIAQGGNRDCRPGIGLDGASSVAISPDGRNVYMASSGSDAVAIFNREPDGNLEQLPGTAGCIRQGGEGGCGSGNGLDLARSVAASADGRSVYVASGRSNAVAIFHRNPDGTLEQPPGTAGCISEGGAGGCRPGIGLNSASGVAISPDGGSVYVASEFASAVAIFHRNPDGTLEQLPGAAGCVSQGGVGGCRPGIGLLSARDVATSPDDKYVYSASTGSNTVAIFERKPDGTLEQLPGAAGCVSQGGVGGCRPGIGLLGAKSIATSADGRNIYVGSFRSNTVAIFNRNPDGGLEQPPGTAGCISQDGTDGACQLGVGLDGPSDIATSSDEKSVYVASGFSNAVAIFDHPAPAAPPASPDARRLAPAVSGFKLVPKRFKAAPKGRSSFRFTLSQPAAVEIEIARIRPGRKVGKGCKQPTPELARRPHCERDKVAGELGFQGRPAGLNKIAFNGKLSAGPLKPGSYRATITATDAAGNRSAPQRASFTVLISRR